MSSCCGRRTLALLITAGILITFNGGSELALADYPSGDNLPGYDSGELFKKALPFILGAAAVMAIVIFATRSDEEKPEAAGTRESAPDSLGGTEDTGNLDSDPERPSFGLQSPFSHGQTLSGIEDGLSAFVGVGGSSLRAGASIRF
jgi:hypothetical protein